MEFIKNAKQCHKLWSIRLLIGALAFQLLDLLWLLYEHMETRHVFSAIGILLTIAATIARVIKQSNLEVSSEQS